MGGGFVKTSTHDWKYSAIQQLGMTLSQKYKDMETAFGEISNKTGKVNFVNFKAFVEKHNALDGFNVTL